MSYSQQNLFKINPAPFAGAWTIWGYKSADSFATVKAANYLANAYDMGVRVGDEIHILDTATPALTIAMIVTCTNAPACTMSQTGVVPST
jgi:hypothetical protein